MLLFEFIIIRLAFVKFKLFAFKRFVDEADTDEVNCISKFWAEAEFNMGALAGAFKLKLFALNCCCSCCICWVVEKGEWAVRCNTGKSDGSNVENVESTVLTEIGY